MDATAIAHLRSQALDRREADYRDACQSRKRKLHELYNVVRYVEGHRPLSKNWGLDDPKSMDEGERRFFDENDIERGRLFNEATLPKYLPSSHATSLDLEAAKTPKAHPARPAEVAVSQAPTQAPTSSVHVWPNGQTVTAKSAQSPRPSKGQRNLPSAEGEADALEIRESTHGNGLGINGDHVEPEVETNGHAEEIDDAEMHDRRRQDLTLREREHSVAVTPSPLPARETPATQQKSAPISNVEGIPVIHDAATVAPSAREKAAGVHPPPPPPDLHGDAPMGTNQTEAPTPIEAKDSKSLPQGQPKVDRMDSERSSTKIAPVASPPLIERVEEARLPATANQLNQIPPHAPLLVATDQQNQPRTVPPQILDQASKVLPESSSPASSVDEHDTQSTPGAIISSATSPDPHHASAVDAKAPTMIRAEDAVPRERGGYLTEVLTENRVNTEEEDKKTTDGLPSVEMAEEVIEKEDEVVPSLPTIPPEELSTEEPVKMEEEKLKVQSLPGAEKGSMEESEAGLPVQGIVQSETTSRDPSAQLRLENQLAKSTRSPPTLEEAVVVGKSKATPGRKPVQEQPAKLASSPSLLSPENAKGELAHLDEDSEDEDRVQLVGSTHEPASRISTPTTSKTHRELMREKEKVGDGLTSKQPSLDHATGKPLIGQKRAEERATETSDPSAETLTTAAQPSRPPAVTDKPSAGPVLEKESPSLQTEEIGELDLGRRQKSPSTDLRRSPALPNDRIAITADAQNLESPSCDRVATSKLPPAPQPPKEFQSPKEIQPQAPEPRDSEMVEADDMEDSITLAPQVVRPAISTDHAQDLSDDQSMVDEPSELPQRHALNPGVAVTDTPRKGSDKTRDIAPPTPSPITPVLNTPALTMTTEADTQMELTQLMDMPATSLPPITAPASTVDSTPQPQPLGESLEVDDVQPVVSAAEPPPSAAETTVNEPESGSIVTRHSPDSRKASRPPKRKRPPHDEIAKLVISSTRHAAAQAEAEAQKVLEDQKSQGVIVDKRRRDQETAAVAARARSTTSLKTKMEIATRPILIEPSDKEEKRLDMFETYYDVKSYNRSLNDLFENASKNITTCNYDVRYYDSQASRILERVQTLQREGLWAFTSAKRSKEPKRMKVHRDYMLDEMRWLREDFREERKLKIVLSKNLATWVKEWHDYPERRKELVVDRRRYGCVPKYIREPGAIKDNQTTEIPNDDPGDVHMDDAEDIDMDDAGVPHSQPTPELMEAGGTPEEESDDFFVKQEEGSAMVAIHDDMEIYHDLPPPAAGIFTLPADEVLYEIPRTKAADELLGQLPLYAPPMPPPSPSRLEEADDSWIKPVIPVSKYADARFVLDEEIEGPPRKKSRYEHEINDQKFADDSDEEGEVATNLDISRETRDRDSRPHPLDPEQRDVALFDPRFKATLVRIRARPFKPPADVPSPYFFEARSPSLWTPAEDDDLRQLAKEYHHNWSLMSTYLEPEGMWHAGSERRSPWECFERYTQLETLPPEFMKTPLYKLIQQRLDMAQRVGTTFTANPAAPNGLQQKRKGTQPMPVQKRRTSRMTTIIDAMRKSAKKRESAAQKNKSGRAIQHSTKKQSDAPVNAGSNDQLRTPQQFSELKHIRAVKDAEQLQILKQLQATRGAQMLQAGRLAPPSTMLTSAPGQALPARSMPMPNGRQQIPPQHAARIRHMNSGMDLAHMQRMRQGTLPQQPFQPQYQSQQYMQQQPGSVVADHHLNTMIRSLMEGGASQEEATTQAKAQLTRQYHHAQVQAQARMASANAMPMTAAQRSVPGTGVMIGAQGPVGPGAQAQMHAASRPGTPATAAAGSASPRVGVPMMNGQNMGSGQSGSPRIPGVPMQAPPQQLRGSPGIAVPHQGSPTMQQSSPHMQHASPRLQQQSPRMQQPSPRPQQVQQVPPHLQHMPQQMQQQQQHLPQQQQQQQQQHPGQGSPRMPQQ